MHWPQTNTRLDILPCSVSTVRQGPHPRTNVNHLLSNYRWWFTTGDQTVSCNCRWAVFTSTVILYIISQPETHLHRKGFSDPPEEGIVARAGVHYLKEVTMWCIVDDLFALLGRIHNNFTINIITSIYIHLKSRAVLSLEWLCTMTH